MCICCALGSQKADVHLHRCRQCFVSRRHSFCSRVAFFFFFFTCLLRGFFFFYILIKDVQPSVFWPQLFSKHCFYNNLEQRLFFFLPKWLPALWLVFCAPDQSLISIAWRGQAGGIHDYWIKSACISFSSQATESCCPYRLMCLTSVGFFFSGPSINELLNHSAVFTSWVVSWLNPNLILPRQSLRNACALVRSQWKRQARACVGSIAMPQMANLSLAASPPTHPSNCLMLRELTRRSLWWTDADALNLEWSTYYRDATSRELTRAYTCHDDKKRRRLKGADRQYCLLMARFNIDRRWTSLL